MKRICGRGLAGFGSVLALVLLAPPAAAAEWWVDQAATPGGDGSEAAPFQTLNDVKSVLATGDTVWMRDGTYEETVDFWHVPTGTDGRTTIAAAPGHRPIIHGDGSGFVIQAGETPNMTFAGLTVRNGESGIHFYYADGGEVIDCTTEDVESAVSFYHSSEGYVSGSKLEGSVSGKESDGTVIEDNEIYGSGAEGITLHADSKNCRYSRNVVHDNTSVNIYLDSISNVVVDSNLVYMSDADGPTTVGIMLADESYENVTAPVLQNVVITNNVIINNESGIRFWDGHFPGQSALRNVVIANNTVVNNQTSAIKWDAGPHDGTVVRNNVFAGQSGKGLLLLQANSVGGIDLDHNLWHLPGVDRPFLWEATTYDHAGWAAATGHGAGDVVEEPQFAGAWELPASNLIPAENSPLVDAGVAVSDVTHDYDGGERPFGDAHDIGAFELGAEPPAGTGGRSSAIGGTAGTSGGTAGGGSGNSASGGDGEDADDASGEDDGCACRTAGGRAPWSAALLSLLALTRRRRRSAQQTA